MTLPKSSGENTHAGHFYEHHTGKSLPDGSLNLDQIPERVGDARRKRRVTRRWDPVVQEWRFMALGNRFYRHLRRNYVCQVPVIVHGTRDDGIKYILQTDFPITKLGIDALHRPLHLKAAHSAS